MRQPTAAVIVASIGVVVLAAGCGGSKQAGPASTTTSSAKAPVAEAALEGLWLSPADINTAMGATGMTVAGTYTTFVDDSGTVPDRIVALPLSTQTPTAMPTADGPLCVSSHFANAAITLLITPIRPWCCFLPRTKRPPSTPPRRNVGRPAPTASSPVPPPGSPANNGTSGRSPTPAAH
jgi:hypothetical protein